MNCLFAKKKKQKSEHGENVSMLSAVPHRPHVIGIVCTLSGIIQTLTQHLRPLFSFFLAHSSSFAMYKIMYPH